MVRLPGRGFPAPVASALARLAPGGRLVAITGAGFSPESPSGRDAFQRLQESGRLVLTVPVAGRVFARQGTTIETRLTVIDRIPAKDYLRVSGLGRNGPDHGRASRAR